jgi:hypothetical protein
MTKLSELIIMFLRKENLREELIANGMKSPLASLGYISRKYCVMLGGGGIAVFGKGFPNVIQITFYY